MLPQSRRRPTSTFTMHFSVWDNKKKGKISRPWNVKRSGVWFLIAALEGMRVAQPFKWELIRSRATFTFHWNLVSLKDVYCQFLWRKKKQPFFFASGKNHVYFAHHKLFRKWHILCTTVTIGVTDMVSTKGQTLCKLATTILQTKQLF